mgnify:FL=1|tara:strand:+ start:3619 stop:5046 length:1428 start_codon:yes stop_codon:yes gene_type:complete
MRSRIILWLFFAGPISFAANAQTYEFLEGKAFSEIIDLSEYYGIPNALFDAVSGVDAYRVIYTMPFLGEDITVSGVVFEPTDLDPLCAHPVHVYMHGTIFARSDAPSFLGYEGQIGYLMAALGFSVVMPDYVGLGLDDQRLHPYVHAESEALAGAHLINAIYTMDNPSGNSHDINQLYISGYSQGGHAAMALHRELQQNWPEYPVQASAPGSGPYDITGVQYPEIFAGETYSRPSYLAYTALAWQSVYGNLYDSINEYFQEPYASQLEDLFDGETSTWEVNSALPYYLDDFVQMEAMDTLLAESSPFLAAANDNDVYDWIPDAPVRMYYCTEDEEVFYQNAIGAEEHMLNLGAENVEAIDLGAYDHGDCAGQAIFGATLWFHSQASICEGITSVEKPSIRTEDAPTIYPNPTRGHLMVNLENCKKLCRWEVYSTRGRLIQSGSGTVLPIQCLQAGAYIIYLPDHNVAKSLIVSRE